MLKAIAAGAVLICATGAIAPALAQPPDDECSRVSSEYSYRRAYFAENQRLVVLYTNFGNVPQYFKAWYAAAEQVIIDGKAMITLRVRAPGCFFDSLPVETMKAVLAEAEQRFAAANDAAKREGLR